MNSDGSFIDFIFANINILLRKKFGEQQWAQFFIDTFKVHKMAKTTFAGDVTY